MKKLFRTAAVILILALSPLCAARAQESAAPVDTSASAPAATYSQQQLDQMLAPVALYPDSLVGQVLMASTYPLEVVEAARWLQAPNNASLSGDQLTQALEQQNWDPSVKALVPFPQVLNMMNTNLQWTEQVGDAFLAQQPDVMDSVQRLRQQAQAAGNLSSTPQQSVSTQGPDISIQPANPDVVYVPTYNPYTVYGAWGYPGYPPYSFYPVGYAWGPSVFGFGAGIVIGQALWGWDRWDWGHHRIDIDDRRYSALNRGRPPINSGVWMHDPAHRGGVAYRDSTTRARYQANRSSDVQRGFRGYGQTTAPVVPARTSSQTRPVNNVQSAQRDASQTRMSPMAQGSRPYQASSARSPSGQSTDTVPRQLVATPHSYGARAEPRVTTPVRMASPMAQPARQASPVFESFSRGTDVRAQSVRGAQSRSGAPALGNAHAGGGAPPSHPSAEGNRGGGDRR